MGQYNSAIITNNGLALVTSAISGGGTIDFTAVKTSSYAYPAGTNIAGLTDLQDIVQTVEPYSAEVFNETMLQVSALFDNDEVTAAYYINTIGLYAKIGSGNPVLFSVCQAVTPDQMPQHSDVSPSSFIYNIQTTVQQASQISVSTNPAGTATQQDILRLEEEKVDIDGGPVENTVVTFDDSGEVEGISTFQNFLDTVVSGIKIGTFFKNFVAGAKFILHTGSIINNLTTNDPDKVLSAAMGKDLQDQITQLNSEVCSSTTIPLKQYADSIPTNSTRLVRYAYDNADAPRGSDGIALIFSQGNSREIYCFSAVNSNSILRLKKLSSTAWADEWTEFKSNNVFTGNNNPASNDANDFNTFGGYYISNTNLIANLPNGIAVAGFMSVFGQYEGPDGRFAQVLFEGNHIWRRFKTTAWENWDMLI